MSIRKAQVSFEAAETQAGVAHTLTAEMKPSLSYIVDVIGRLSMAVDDSSREHIDTRLDDIGDRAHGAKQALDRTTAALSAGFGELAPGQPMPTHAKLQKILTPATKRYQDGYGDVPGITPLVEGVRDDFNSIQGHLNAIRETLEGSNGEGGTKAKLAQLGDILQALTGLHWFPNFVQTVFNQKPYAGDLPLFDKELTDFREQLFNS
jgi:hypothetical protein